MSCKLAVFPPARCLGPLRARSGRGQCLMAEKPIKVSCLGVGCCSNILSHQGQPTPSWELPRGSYSLKGQWKEEGRHTIFIYSNKHHGQSESDGDDWSVGTEGWHSHRDGRGKHC